MRCRSSAAGETTSPPIAAAGVVGGGVEPEDPVDTGDARADHHPGEDPGRSGHALRLPAELHPVGAVTAGEDETPLRLTDLGLGPQQEAPQTA